MATVARNSIPPLTSPFSLLGLRHSGEQLCSSLQKCFRRLAWRSVAYGTLADPYPVAPVAYQVVLEPGMGQFREFEPPRVRTRENSWGLFLVHKLTCGKHEDLS